MKNIILLFLSGLVLWSCGEKTENADPLVSISLKLSDQERVLKLSEIVDSVSFIGLETDSVSRIGSINKVIVTDSAFIIVDTDIASSAFVFTKSGKYLSRIGRRGRGRGEHISLTDVAVGNDKVYLLDCHGKKILKYSMSGDYSGSYEFDYTAYSFKHLADDKFAFSCDYVSNRTLGEADKVPNCFIYDAKAANVIAEDMYFNPDMKSDIIPTVLNNLNPYMYQVYGNMIYNVDEKGFFPFVELVYPELYAGRQKKFFDEIDKNSMSPETLTKWLEDNPIPRIVTFFDCKSMYFAFCVNEGNLYYNFYYPQTQTLVEGVGKGCLPVKDDIFNCLTITPLAAEEDVLYCYAEPAQLKNIPAFSDMNGESNPVLVKLYVKKR